MILNFVKMLAKIHEIKKEIHHLTENSRFKEFIYLFFLIFIKLFLFYFLATYHKALTQFQI